MGITPKITNEVGFLTDDVRFNDDVPKPRQAIAEKEITKKENALIAFPNDMARTLRPTNTDEVM